MMHLRGELTEDHSAMPGRAQSPEESEDAQGKPSVTNTIDDERLVPGGGVGVLFVPEPDQRVRAQPDAFPADEHQQQIVC